MAGYRASFISGEATPEETRDELGRLLTQLAYIFKQLDSMNVRRINTNSTVVKSEKGETVINGSQFLMSDADGKPRAVLGLNQSTGIFEFTLLNVEGKETIKLSDTGDARFSGLIEASTIRGSKIEGLDISAIDINGSTLTGLTINGGTINGADINGGTISVDTDIKIGDTISLRDGDDVGGTISIFNGTAPTLSIASKANRPVYITNGIVAVILAGYSVNIEGSIFSAGSFRAANGANGSFTTDGGKTVTVEGGVITNITP